jgi:uncharacterized protein (DUF488 family)
MEIYTIGFTKKSAKQFFSSLTKAGIERLIDIRLNNTSQLAGFAKQADLSYFLQTICSIEYLHLPDLAPTHEILKAYQKKEINWDEYERRFHSLLSERRVAAKVDKTLFFKKSVLLCSEAKPERCHRRLVAEYLKNEWGNIDIHHL